MGEGGGRSRGEEAGEGLVALILPVPLATLAMLHTNYFSQPNTRSIVAVQERILQVSQIHRPTQAPGPTPKRPIYFTARCSSHHPQLSLPV